MKLRKISPLSPPLVLHQVNDASSTEGNIIYPLKQWIIT